MKNYHGVIGHMFKDIKHFYLEESRMVIGKCTEIYTHFTDFAGSFHEGYAVYIIIASIIITEIIECYKHHRLGFKK